MSKFERVINAMGITFYKLDKIVKPRTVLIALIIVPIVVGWLSYANDGAPEASRILEWLGAMFLISILLVGCGYFVSYTAAKKNQHGAIPFWIGIVALVPMFIIVHLFYEDKSEQIKNKQLNN